MKSIYCGAGTHVGQIRDHNEDAFLSQPDLGLWIVADGMGGHAAGEIASALAIKMIQEQVAANVSLPVAVAMAHQAILDQSSMNEEQQGMGCTVVVLQLKGQRYEIAWVGDSRAYLWDGQSLVQLSKDHSFVQQLIDGGHLTEEEARFHPQRNVITQALGASDLKSVRVDSVSGQLYRDQQILLCSDGLTGEVDDSAITDILLRDGDEQAKIDALIAAANENGGSDNITVILVSSPPDAPKSSLKGDTRPLDTRELNQYLQEKKKKVKYWPLLLVPIILLIGLVLFFRGGDKAPVSTSNVGSPHTVPLPVADESLAVPVHGEAVVPTEAAEPAAVKSQTVPVEDFIPARTQAPQKRDVALPYAGVQSAATAETTLLNPLSQETLDAQPVTDTTNEGQSR